MFVVTVTFRQLIKCHFAWNLVNKQNANVELIGINFDCLALTLSHNCQFTYFLWCVYLYVGDISIIVATQV